MRDERAEEIGEEESISTISTDEQGNKGERKKVRRHEHKDLDTS
jgi:hypothetical protein